MENKKSYLWFILLLLLTFLAGGFYIFKSSWNNSYQNTQINNISLASSSVSINSNIKTFELIVKDKKLFSGPDVLKVTEGDLVDIKISSDVSEEFHLHGYDKSVDLEKGKTVNLKFSANLTGRFPYELEEDKVELGALEVSPK